MKKVLLIILSFIVTCNTLHAQIVLQPAEPNEVCMQAWQNYQKADVLWKAGWGLYGAGLAAVFAGTEGFVSMPKMSGGPGNALYQAGLYSTISLACLGAGAFISSIPCLIVGQARRKAAFDIYCRENCAPELTCDQIKNYYKKGDVLWKTGWGLFAVGGSAIIAGFLAYPGVISNGYDQPTYHAIQYTCFSIISVGIGTFLASIPCITIGQYRRQMANKLNGNCADQSALTFSLQTSSAGLGLAMQF